MRSSCQDQNLWYSLAQMSLATKVQFFREKVLTRKWFQISAFILVLIAASFLFSRVSSYRDLEALLRYGYFGIFLVNLITAATIFFRIPGEAVNMAAATILNPWLLGLVASVGATVGELTSYAAGYWGRKLAIGEYSQKYHQARIWLDRYGSLAVFLFALLPILIFDLLGLIAGSFRFSLWKFIVACWAGRIIRSLVEAYLGWGIIALLPRLW